jgi:glutaredoxin
MKIRLMSVRPMPHFLALSCALASLVSLAAQAQQIYRIVGENGRVTFTDQAPAPSSTAKVSTIGVNLTAGTANTGGLPFDLQQIALKYPVVLYTANNCAVCNTARSHLMSRGIPFAEKSVTTNEEIEAFLKLSGDSPMPYLTIGSQQLKGYSAGDWSQYLTAAAYPEKSQLPAGYKYASAAPLIEPKKVVPPEERKAKEEATPPSPSAPSPSNPAGIKF